MARKHRTPVEFSATPRVSLLPERQRAEQLHEQTLPKLLAALVVSGVVAGLIWAAGLVPVFLANQELAAAENESNRLLTEISGYTDVQQTLSTVGALSSERAQLTATEVLFMQLRDDISAQVPEGSSLTAFAAQLAGGVAEADATATQGSLCVPTGASVTVTVSTPDAAAGLGRASQLITGVSRLEGYQCSEVLSSTTNTTEESAVTEVQVSFAFDDSVRAARFVEGEQ